MITFREFYRASIQFGKSKIFRYRPIAGHPGVMTFLDEGQAVTYGTIDERGVHSVSLTFKFFPVTTIPQFVVVKDRETDQTQQYDIDEPFCDPEQEVRWIHDFPPEAVDYPFFCYLMRPWLYD